MNNTEDNKNGLTGEQLVTLIKQQYKDCNFNRSGSYIKLSDYTEINIQGDELHITILPLTKNPVSKQNMQETGCAFEGWAICLKAWLADQIKTVELDWTTPQEKLSENEEQHYNRFLYRVIKFKEWYDWFNYNPEKQNEINSFNKELTKGANNNNSNKDAAEGKNDNENKVEYNIINNKENKQKLIDTFGLKLIGHHLPVGVKKADDSNLFPGRQSAIDIWGISHDNILKVIELKYIDKNNKPNIQIGIISELFFYCNIMNDIHYGVIQKPDIPMKEGIESEKSLNKEDWNSVEGVMLATDYHPLLYRTKELLEILNSNREGIKFSMYQYDWDMDNNELLEIKPFNPESCK